MREADIRQLEQNIEQLRRIAHDPATPVRVREALLHVIVSAQITLLST
jgi:hypothetical protein